MRASVIIPSYNAALTLQETLDSIIPQLTREDEAIIIDDGSTDNTLEVVKPYLSRNVIYLRQENSGGPAAPRNKGIAHARGRYIFLFDSDDLMLPGKIENSIDSLARYPNAGLLFSNFRTIDENGLLLKANFLEGYTLISQLRNNQSEPSFLIEVPDGCEHLASENFIGTSGVVIRKEVLERVGSFDESLNNGDDRDMWFRITRQYPIIFYDKVLHSYRISRNGISKGNATKRAISKIKVLEKQIRNPISKKFEKEILKLLSDNYLDIAYDNFQKNELKTARTNALKALNRHASIRAVKILMATFIGKVGVTAIRGLKRVFK
ncbi:glycosyltransferase [Marinobacter mobilis]|uniref:glycosyltransferase n=1 Tax=Marinobacter mobilis TaxID=488533 RepID=UPI0035C70B05